MKDFLLLGSEGFIGKEIAARVGRSGRSLVAVDINGECDVRIDLCNGFNKLEELVRKVKPKVIINLAAISTPKMCEEMPEHHLCN